MDSATDYLRENAPNHFLTLLRENVLRDDAPVRVWGRVLASEVARAVDAARPYTAPLAAKATDTVGTMMTPVLDRIAQAAYNAPDIVVLLFAILVIVLALQVLALLRRVLAWWTRLLFRMIFWSGVALLAAAVWQRGLDQSAQDAAALVGRLQGFAYFVGDIWHAEYNKYKQQQAQAQAAHHQGAAYSQRGGAGGWSGR